MDRQDESLPAAIGHGQRLLLAAGIDEARQEARRLLALALGVSAAGLLARRGISRDDHARFDGLLRRRAAREPLAYITGSQGFWTLDLEVSTDTLIPRADSETVIETLCRLQPRRDQPMRVLDLGTGTGCLLLAALAEYPDATGVGLDLSSAACHLAAHNARRNGLADRAMMLCGRWHEALSTPGGGGFDLVLSNPPYIPSAEIPLLMPEVARHEPHLALDGGADGLEAYRVILRGLDQLLAPDGIVLFEIGRGQDAAVPALGAAAGMRLLASQPDLAGIPRCIAFAQA